jgi:DnaJ-domain-containing protein 1
MFSSFKQFVISSANPVPGCVLLLLGWLAAADDHLDDRERALLASLAADLHVPSLTELMLQVARSKNSDAIQLACEVLRVAFDPEKRTLLIRLCFTMALADGALGVGENHVIRFLADVFGIQFSTIDALFREMTGAAIPDPSDLSRAAWWQSRRAKQHSEQGIRSRGKLDLRARALATLGLLENASTDDVKAAYRRLAQVHHPDKFMPLGDAAVRAATDTFRRIQESYEYLIGHA